MTRGAGVPGNGDRGTGSLENVGCGKRGVCGKNKNKNKVCKQTSSLSMALDEIPTATCEPSEIAA